MKKVIIKLRDISGAFLVTAFFLLLIVSCGTQARLPSTNSHFSSGLELDMFFEKDTVHFPGTEIVVKTVYNNDSIRILLKTSDTRTSASLIINGLAVWIDPEANKNKNFGVTYPSASSSVIQNEYKRSRDTLKLKEESDTLGFDISRLVKSIKDRGAVVLMGERARFAEEHQADVYMEDNKIINYIITYPFSALGITDIEGQEISIGLVSEPLPAPQQDSYERPPGTMGPRGRGSYPYDRRYPPRNSREQQEQLKSFNVWMVFVLNEEKNNNGNSITE